MTTNAVPSRSLTSCMALLAVVALMLTASTIAVAQSAAPEHVKGPLQVGAAVSGGVFTGTSGQPTPTPQVPASAPRTGMQDGIKLHGHWTIDVKNPDGTQVQHHEFENQLQYDGTQFLTALLSGYGVAGDYAIYFTNATAQATTSPTTNVVCPAPASTTTSTFPYCSIVQNVNSQPGIFHCLHYVCVPGLTAAPAFGSGTGLPNFTLMGSIAAPQAGAVVNVYVGFNGCNIASTVTPPTPTSPGSITATACEAQTTGSYSGTLSGTTITPITVVAGQIIQITVTFTFS